MRYLNLEVFQGGLARIVGCKQKTLVRVVGYGGAVKVCSVINYTDINVADRNLFGWIVLELLLEKLSIHCTSV